MLVISPAVAGLSYVLTNILYSDAVASGALPAGSSYAVLVAGFVFAICVVYGIDKTIVEE